MSAKPDTGDPGRDRRLTPDGEEMRFRSASAPGLDEDDLFAALSGLPGRGALWGDAGAFRPDTPDEDWNEERERRRRHERLMAKWPPTQDDDPGDSPRR